MTGGAIFRASARATLRELIETGFFRGKRISQKDYSRTHFNRLDSTKKQQIYLNRLEKTRLYYLIDRSGFLWQVPKYVYDAIDFSF